MWPYFVQLNNRIRLVKRPRMKTYLSSMFTIDSCRGHKWPSCCCPSMSEHVISRDAWICHGSLCSGLAEHSSHDTV